jgi:hypothetical protein
MLNGEDGAVSRPYAQSRWQKPDETTIVLRLRLGNYGAKLRQGRHSRPHFPIPVPARVGRVNGSRKAIPCDSWRDLTTGEICIRADRFFANSEGVTS